MATTIDEKTEKGIEPQVSYLEDAAEAIRDNAIAEAQKKLGVSQSDLSLEHLLNTHPAFFGYFKSGMAMEVAEVLATNDKNVQAIYVHDPDWNPFVADVNTTPDATVYLLVKVDATAALEAFIDSLDRALTAALRELPSPLFSHREFILDVQLISEEDIRLRRGYGVLITSVFAPALKIWEREA